MAHKILILSRRHREDRREMVDEFLASRNCELLDIPTRYPVDQEQLCELVAEAEGIITGLEWISKRVIESAPKLKVVSAAGVGYDHIDARAATAHGVAVGICAGVNNHSVSELALGMMISLSRHTGVYDRSIREGSWLPYGGFLAGRELFGKTVGIVGLGRVGHSTALLARAFGMRVLATDIAWDITFAAEHGISYVPLERLLRESDFVTLHCPLTSATRDLIDERTLEMMKPSAFLINTARGPIVKESALVNALSSKRIAGAGLDVFRVEPHPDNPYVEFPNVVLTPHIGGATAEASERSVYLSMVNVTNVFNGMEPHCQVNPGVSPHLEFVKEEEAFKPPSSL
ncbi:MAG TPA: phosphoglycerate dehydrogenase [Thermomicrobiales bacterium]|nr:phosphoglycerate dehydrogenase [Thermomicrobiales bacterium]